MSRKPAALVPLVIFIFSTMLLISCNGALDSNKYCVIADHTIVADYSKIPDEYMAIIKTLLVDIAGESHSAAYRTGMDMLEAQNPRFSVTTFDGTIPASSGSLRLGRHSSAGTGEEDFYTNSTAISTIQALIKTQNDNGNPIHVLGFGWCWDMTWTNDPGGTEDPVYGVHWAGSSDGGPEGNRIWGLDAGDTALTGNSVCMNTYLSAVNKYNSYCRDNEYKCIVIYTTGPVDGNAGTENGYQREIKHDYIRNYVKINGGVLFDYADILCYNDSGVKNTATWNDSGTYRIHPQIHSDNLGDASIGHIGSNGALRLAKAMWWMLARMAGWDGK